MSDDHLLHAFHLTAAVDAGTATAAERADLLRLVSGDRAIADALADDLVMRRLLRQAAEGIALERFVAGVAVRVASERDGSAFLRRVEGRVGRGCRRPAPRGGRWMAAAALAACVLAALLVTWQRGADAPGLVTNAASGATSIAGRPAKTGDRAGPGDVLACAADGRLELRAPDGSELTLVGPAEARIGTFAPSLSLHLERGTLAALVAPQPSDRPLRVRTPHGEAVVLGTRFTLTVGDTTELAVDAGRVRLIPSDGSAAIEVGAGARAVAGTRAPEPAAPTESTAPAPPTAPTTGAAPTPGAIAPTARVDALRAQALAWYDFDEGQGAVVHDRAGRGTGLDLVIADPAAVRWLPGAGLRLEQPTRLASAGPAAAIAAACRRSGELTIVAAVDPDPRNASGDPRDYPKRLVSLTAGLDARDVSLSQGLYRGDRRVLDVRLRTSASTSDGKPSVTTAEPVMDPPRALVIAFSRDRAGRCRYHIDGRPVPARLVEESADGGDRRLSPPAPAQVTAGDLGTWSDRMPLVVGAELEAGPAGTRAWLGTLHRIALFDRPLTDEELAALAP